LETFWKLFAARYCNRPIIFAYELKNEPEVGWNDAMKPAWDEWLAQQNKTPAALAVRWSDNHLTHFSDIPVPSPVGNCSSNCLLDFQHFREDLADTWTRRQVNAIKSVDPSALVTCGAIQWSVPTLLPAGPRHYSGFMPARQAALLDFLEIHFYPLAKGAYDYRSAEAETANLAYLEEVVRENSRAGKPVVLGEFGWYGGGKPRFDKGSHPFASEEQQARYCRKVVETSAPYGCGWLNWGLYDQPEAADCSEFTGLLTSDGHVKTWGHAFSELSARAGSASLPQTRATSRPELPWDACLTSKAAEDNHRAAYLHTFLLDGKIP
jgi:hypothetical protein